MDWPGSAVSSGLAAPCLQTATPSQSGNASMVTSGSHASTASSRERGALSVLVGAKAGRDSAAANEQRLHPDKRLKPEVLMSSREVGETLNQLKNRLSTLATICRQLTEETDSAGLHALQKNFAEHSVGLAELGQQRTGARLVLPIAFSSTRRSPYS